MKFWKYHGLGNDFIIINNMDNSIFLDSKIIKAMCNRHFGIGADGVILVEKSSTADVRMTIYNSDGSRPDMCGNGVRCFAKYVYDKGIIISNNIIVETDAGIMNIELATKGNQVISAIVNMGQPVFAALKIPVDINEHELINHSLELQGKSYKITSLLMGVPHTVLFVDNIEDEVVIQLGKAIENLELFPNKTNVNFVKIIDKENIILRTWERGAGYTYACGTGACAGVAAGVVNGLTSNKVKVQLRAGDLSIHWKDRGDIYMEGPAIEVFEGFYTASKINS